MAIAGLYKIFNHWSEEGTLWCISDTHFGDADIKAAFPNRPSDEELVKLINSKVGRKDTLLLLGDVGDLDYAKQLRGKKILVMGNHDAGRTIYEEIFDEVYSGCLMIAEKVILSHEPIKDLPHWLCNLHGHDHFGRQNGKRHFNFCADVIGYIPVNLNQWFKQGHFASIESIHRETINAATKRKIKRGGKKIGER